MLTTTHLTITTPQHKTLLSDISTTFDKGKLYGLIGHNGSGKSTLIKSLSGELMPTTGQVNIDGDELRLLAPSALAKKLAYLPQKLPETGSFTVKELVMLGRFPHQSWLAKPTDIDHKIVQQAMTRTGVVKFSDEPVGQLSGGEKARSWLAMCLAQQTQYLLLDEPLAALDIVYQVEVLRLLRSLVDEQGLTVIIILHDINLASQFCDELVALKQGRLVGQGATSELMTQDKLFEIFGIRLTLFAHPTGTHQVAVV